MTTIGSLFSGIGGIELGLERSGMKVIWQSEIDAYASRVLKKHWPEIPNLGDVTKIDWSDIERPNVICGGFPCQDISYAGRGAGIKGTRSSLWIEFARAVRDLRPDYALVENVAALTARGMHLRWRIWIVAYPMADTEGIPERTGLRACEPRIFRRRRFSDSRRALIMANTESERRGASGTKHPGETGADDVARHASEFRREDPWATEPDVGRVAHGIPARVDRLKGLGNSVVPQIPEWIGQGILEDMGR